MKRRMISSFIILAVLITGCAQSDQYILNKVSENLKNLKTIEYQAEFRNFNPMDGKLGKSHSALAFLDFSSTDTIIGAKYLISDEQGDYGFNGSTAFSSFKDENRLKYWPVKSYDDLVWPYLYFSMQNLRSLLPQLLNDTSIIISKSADTLINNTECYQFAINMHRKNIDMLTGKLHLVKSRNRKFLLIIDKGNYFPKQFISLSNENSPEWIVSHNNLNFSATMADSVFDYSLRDKNFQKYTTEEYNAVQQNEKSFKNNSYIGTKAIDWTLPSMNGDSVRLSQLKAKLILLEFWFPYCTGCVKAIPDINEIQETYKNNGLLVYGVEFQRPDSLGLSDYIAKAKIKYPTLYSGKNIALKYGVSAGPTVFLINRAGKIVYANIGFQKEGLINAIKGNL